MWSSTGLRARDGATRGGSLGIFGYTGGHGASIRPSRMSRSCSSSSGASGCGSAIAWSHGSPSAATRSGTEASVSSSWSTVSSSSQKKGVETCPPARARTDQAPNTVLCGAFWLKSTKMRSPRSSFHQASVTRSGRRRASSRASATAAERTT